MASPDKKASGYAEIGRLHDVVDLHILLHRKLKLPRPWTDKILRRLKHTVNPRQMLLRREMARGLAPSSVISETAGHLTFGSDEFPGINEVVADCSALYHELRARGDLDRLRREAKKDFLVSIAKGTDFAQHPRIFDFMISRPVVELAATYMGAVPVLSWASLWWTPPNNSMVESALYHRDGEDSRQIKVFVNICDVTAESGPFTLLAADDSARVKAKIRYYSGRLTDEVIGATGVAGEPITLTGPAGAGAFVDTSRCLHYGSRCNHLDRLVLMFQFTSFLAPRGRDPRWAAALAGRNFELDPLQRLVLNLQ